MTLALTNVDLLHRGWEDAVSEITPHLPEVRATMETEYAALLHESRIDEQALLAAVREVAAVAARAAGADKARLLSRAMHRSVYEYLLSLDAMTPEETEGDADRGGVATDPSRLIGMEEVAEIEGRQAAIRAEEEAAAAAIAAAAQAEADRVAAERAEAERVAAEERAEAERIAAEERAEAERIAAEERAAAVRAAAELAAAEQAAAERAAAHRAAAERAAQERAAAERAAQERAEAEAEAERVEAEERAAAERATAYRASLEAEAAAAEEIPGVDPAPAGETEPAADGNDAAGGFYRPRFKLFRRSSGEAGASEAEEATTGSPSWWRGPDAPPAPRGPGPEAAEPVEPAASIEPAGPAEPAGTSTPAPFADPVPVPRPSRGAGPGEARAATPPRDAGFAVQPRDGFHLTEFADFVRPAEKAAPQPVVEAPEEAPATVDGDGGKAAKGWHVRSSRRPNSGEGAADFDLDGGLDEDDWEERRLIDSDPTVAQAHGDVNDLLRRRKCDEAASLLQKLAADHGSRSVAELALDAGDRCRALGKGNAALSCYIAASRADPSFEGPLMRLADVCLDDRDIDLAVTYLERVAKLHRQRGDNRGALRLYRKIATIAPYRDDILATLMRANTTGQFED